MKQRQKGERRHHEPGRHKRSNHHHARVRHGPLALLMSPECAFVLRRWHSFKQVNDSSHALNMSSIEEESKEGLRAICDYSQSGAPLSLWVRARADESDAESASDRPR